MVAERRVLIDDDNHNYDNDDAGHTANYWNTTEKGFQEQYKLEAVLYN